eukprot:TRINITY_DN29252_c0_g1_i1.p2 TRINITY_DN29252_c0_g1~~TRINITY_DN29252_c0_g1_i1.p2  ORF type:complete len:107 (-),score=24.48 TRINITY_DN29252_c0_g1_i1:39-359(-)
MTHSSFKLDNNHIVLASELITTTSIDQALSFASHRTGIPLDFVFQILPTGPESSQIRSTMANNTLSVGGSTQSDDDDFRITVDSDAVHTYAAVSYTHLTLPTKRIV